MRLEFQPQAERDLEGIGDYIAQDNPRRAITFLQELRAQCRKILLIRHGLLQSPDAVQLEPVEGLRHLSPSKVYE